MASIKQEQNLKLGQKLSPKQILFTRLLEVPSFQMEQRIQQELVDNPALEIAEYDEDDKSEKDIDQDMDDPLSDNDSDNQENDLMDNEFSEEEMANYKACAKYMPFIILKVERQKEREKEIQEPHYEVFLQILENNKILVENAA